jgi:hypothetical protein
MIIQCKQKTQVVTRLGCGPADVRKYSQKLILMHSHCAELCELWT